jgi:hypothetical protein
MMGTTGWTTPTTRVTTVAVSREAVGDAESDIVASMIRSKEALRAEYRGIVNGARPEKALALMQPDSTRAASQPLTCS